MSLLKDMVVPHTFVTCCHAGSAGGKIACKDVDNIPLSQLVRAVKQLCLIKLKTKAVQSINDHRTLRWWPSSLTGTPIISDISQTASAVKFTLFLSFIVKTLEFYFVVYIFSSIHRYSQ